MTIAVATMTKRTNTAREERSARPPEIFVQEASTTPKSNLCSIEFQRFAASAAE